MKKKSRPRASRRFAVAFLAVVFAGAAALYVRAELYNTRYGSFHEPVFVEVAKGLSTRDIGGRLAEAGVLRSSWHLQALRLLRPGAVLQAGDYQFTRPATADDIYNRLARGDVFFHELLVPEGSTLYDIARLAEEKGIVPADELIAAARDPELIADLDPAAPSLEGYLFPSTYRFHRRATAEDVCRAMTQQFRKVWRSLGLQADVHNTVTLASLVEKEAAQPRERPRIAGVYLNRLAHSMKLDCDPTVIYAALVEHRWRGTIYRSDLDRLSPYNTYQRPGLPLGPISNPGEASLAAALEPEKTGALYFVARPDGSGTHVFSETFAAHQKAVAEYRRGTAQSSSKANPRVAQPAQPGASDRSPRR